MARAYAWGMFGMFGRAADPFNFDNFCRRVADQGIDVRHSPYRDYQTDVIIHDLLSLPVHTVKFVFGASLGANNAPAIVHAVKNVRQIDGIFGFQASGWPGALRVPIEPNCRFARLATDPDPLITFGLSSYIWTAVDPKQTELHIVNTTDPHPGDGNPAIQNQFLSDMMQIIKKAGT